MIETLFLEKDEDFIRLIPLVMELSLKTETTLHQHLFEVTASLRGEEYICLIRKREGEITSYVCGKFMERWTFMITQALSHESPDVSMLIYQKLETFLHNQGVSCILMMTKLPPRVFKRYGFRVERLLLRKDLIPQKEV